MNVQAATAAPQAAVEAELDWLAIDTIRTLAMDAVERARSGHPGMPMALAPAAYLLFTRYLKHNPRDSRWPDRDRFVLSAGHGSMLLYAVLHLSGYDLPMAELRRFRQWGSRTPGHPEFGQTPGVETTTGPLGQGFANGVGMAMAELFLRERYGAEVMDHRVFAICSDGDLMEGVSAEAASLAGHLGLGRLVYLYDDNGITIDGPTSLAFDREDVEARFRAYGWHVTAVEDANDLSALEAAVEDAMAEGERPSLVCVRSVIGWPAPTKQGSAAAHGQPLGDDEVRAAKEALGWDPGLELHVPQEVYARFAEAAERGAEEQRRWAARVARWRGAYPELGAEWDRIWSGRPVSDLAPSLPEFDPRQQSALATRAASGRVMAAIAHDVPTMMGGSADLAESTKTEFPAVASFSRERSGRNVHWGVREHAMAAAVNGMALHGGIVKPYGSTFLVFSDYMRPSIRLSALMRLPVIWVFSHDSVGLGEDGPTHQPVEHLAALRAVPGLTVIRPADAAETGEAWRVALEELEGPVCLLLSRQSLPVLDRAVLTPAAGLARGAYVLAEPPDAPFTAVIAASGSEVALALEARQGLASRGVPVRVVSMPSWELFEAQPAAYRESVLPAGVRVVSVEAGVSLGWSRWASRVVALDRFGASAPGAEVMRNLGFTPERVVAAVVDALGRAD
jgi:transketolase